MIRVDKASLWVVFIMLSPLGLVSGANAEQTVFPAKRFPFLPNLVDDRNPLLCKMALEDARNRFMDMGQDPPILMRDTGGIKWINWDNAESLMSETESIKTLDFDLDGTGKKQTVIYRSFPHSWRGDNYYAYLVQKKAVLDALKKNPEELTATLSRIDDHPDTSDASIGIIPYYPTAFLDKGNSKEFIGTGSNWDPHNLFQWRNRYYFYDELISSGPMDFLSLYRLQKDGTVELHCKIQLMPAEQILSTFRKLPGLASFLKVLTGIGTGGGGNCGTLNANFRHDKAATDAIDRAAIRPWAVSRSDGNYYVYNERMRSFMEDWGIGDIWNRREVQTLSEHIEPATKAMERYFVQNFALNSSDARTQANVVVEELIAAWIMVPNGYVPEADLYSIRYSPATKAIMDRDIKALKDALSQPASSDPYLDNKPLSDLLHDAAEWPDGMALLLKSGADPNSPQGRDRGFGKRPLMTAAHMNRPDSVRMLLKHGADPNLRTVKGISTCGMTIGRGDRTALMYAAENAGTSVMKLLLDAGADPAAKDSKGNGVDFYLAMNPRFSPEEKRLDVRALLNHKRGNIREPGFDCAKATMEVEKNICGNEILRLMDGEMTDAYIRLRRTLGTEAKDDQRQWIRNRDASCNSGDEQRDIGCLQDKTRARVRYLHNRLEEIPPS
jgi:uncharacterized protein YecT (DUF1311 family)